MSKARAPSARPPPGVRPSPTGGRPKNGLVAARSSNDDVARRAYELYEQRGRRHGHDWDDWLKAERELRPGR